MNTSTKVLIIASSHCLFTPTPLPCSSGIFCLPLFFVCPDSIKVAGTPYVHNKGCISASMNCPYTSQLHVSIFPGTYKGAEWLVEGIQGLGASLSTRMASDVWGSRALGTPSVAHWQHTWD